MTAPNHRPALLVFGLCTWALAACAEGERSEGGGADVTRGGAPLPADPAATPAFADEASCVQCHAEAVAAWEGSHHDLAMQVAEPGSVLGDFGGAEDVPGPARRFRVDGDAFLVDAEDEAGDETSYEVAFVFGVEPLQQVLAEFPGGRLQCLTTAWDTEQQRWFSLYPDGEPPAGDALHWTGRYQNWNTMCAECHTTGFLKAYDAERDVYATSYEREDVGCQACHGPASEHVAWARGDQQGPAPALVALAKGPDGGQLDACARCHSRRASLRSEHRHGAPFLDGYVPERLHAGLYHADGQILDEVYVYGSFVQSRMHRNGVSCSDCHEPHTLELLTAGNSLCGQCHSPHAPLDRFPTLTAKDYDSPEHHFHQVGSPGAQCVECHMPTRTYMQVDPRRDHSFRVPRPEQTLSLGVPNACNACHDDRSAQWAADEIARRRSGQEPPRRERDFASVFHDARRGADVGAALADVARDGELAGIVRATAIDLLAGTRPAEQDALVAAAQDEDEHVRISAAAALERLPGPLQLQVGVPLLSDELRSVRVAAARSLSGLERAGVPLPDAARTAFASAWQEYEEVRSLALDTPGGWLGLGVDRQAQGDAPGAIAAYERALAMDPGFLPARFNLATLLSGTGQSARALKLVEEGVQMAPEEGELHFSLGLLRAELGDLEGAALALAEAALLVPRRERLHYNLGLVLWQLGRLDEAEGPLHAARQRSPSDVDVLNALARLYLQRGEPELAAEWIAELERLVPGAAWVRELRDSLRE